jgi:CcmD family protein
MSWLFAAFAVIWVVFFVYLISLDNKQRAISKEIAGLKKKLTG